MGGLLAFIGGNAFRQLWGEVSHFITARQEHKQELERIEQQGRLQAAAHDRNMQALKVQSDLGIKEVVVRAESAVNAAEVDAWVDVVKATSKPSGIAWIDGWNQSIRPAVATCALVALLGEAYVIGHLTGFHYEVFGAALGIFLADRQLAKRGK